MALSVFQLFEARLDKANRDWFLSADEYVTAFQSAYHRFEKLAKEQQDLDKRNAEFWAGVVVFVVCMVVIPGGLILAFGSTAAAKMAVENAVVGGLAKAQRTKGLVAATNDIFDWMMMVQGNATAMFALGALANHGMQGTRDWLKDILTKKLTGDQQGRADEISQKLSSLVDVDDSRYRINLNYSAGDEVRKIVNYAEYLSSSWADFKDWLYQYPIADEAKIAILEGLMKESPYLHPPGKATGTLDNLSERIELALYMNMLFKSLHQNYYISSGDGSFARVQSKPITEMPTPKSKIGYGFGYTTLEVAEVDDPGSVFHKRINYLYHKVHLGPHRKLILAPFFHSPHGTVPEDWERAKSILEALGSDSAQSIRANLPHQ